MILEKETFQQFGYYPSKLSFKSDRNVCFECSSCERVFIKAKRRAKNSLLCRECYLLAIKKDYRCIDCGRNITNKSKRWPIVFSLEN